MTTEETPAAPTRPLNVTPAPDSRLEYLAGRYRDAKALADQAAADLKAITDGIKVELSLLAPGEPKVRLQMPEGRPLQLTAKVSWRLDAKGLKAADPETYVRWAYQSTSWELREVSAE